jgi:hypothetical protein
LNIRVVQTSLPGRRAYSTKLTTCPAKSLPRGACPKSIFEAKNSEARVPEPSSQAYCASWKVGNLSDSVLSSLVSSQQVLWNRVTRCCQAAVGRFWFLAFLFKGRVLALFCFFEDAAVRRNPSVPAGGFVYSLGVTKRSGSVVDRGR